MLIILVFWKLFLQGDVRYTKLGAIVHCFIVTVHCCVLCDATQGSLSFSISKITPSAETIQERSKIAVTCTVFLTVIKRTFTG